MIRPNKKLERKLIKSGKNWIIGIDEVGMGALAGPVVVCAVLLSKKFYKKRDLKLAGVRDSKLLSRQQRERLKQELSKNRGIKFVIGYCQPKTIDRLNIYQTARLAMRRAILRLLNNSSFMLHTSEIAVLVDGPSKITGLDLEQIAVIGGDKKVFTIACASIIAKVHRDKMMQKYAKRFPKYGFEKHKGYGTQLHQAIIAAIGTSPIHRKSFRPCYIREPTRTARVNQTI